MTDIHISVKDKIAVKTDKTFYVCGNSDFRILFDFDAEWDAYEEKTARFSHDGSYTDIVFSGSECAVPIISDIYCFHVGVYAGDLHTTTPARVPCRKSILCGGGIPADPAPDVYNQLMERMNELESPDWNQNDSTAKDYIKNRTHYTDGEIVQPLDDKYIPATIPREMLVHGTQDYDSSSGTYTVTLDKSFEQMREAQNNGAVVAAEIGNDFLGYKYYRQVDANRLQIVLSCSSARNNEIKDITIKSTGEIVVSNISPASQAQLNALYDQIPTDEHINDLINQALAGIPDASEVAY